MAVELVLGDPKRLTFSLQAGCLPGRSHRDRSMPETPSTEQLHGDYRRRGPQPPWTEIVLSDMFEIVVIGGRNARRKDLLRLPAA